MKTSSCKARGSVTKMKRVICVILLTLLSALSCVAISETLSTEEWVFRFEYMLEHILSLQWEKIEEESALAKYNVADSTVTLYGFPEMNHNTVKIDRGVSNKQVFAQILSAVLVVNESNMPMEQMLPEVEAALIEAEVQTRIPYQLSIGISTVSMMPDSGGTLFSTVTIPLPELPKGTPSIILRLEKEYGRLCTLREVTLDFEIESPQEDGGYTFTLSNDMQGSVYLEDNKTDEINRIVLMASYVKRDRDAMMRTMGHEILTIMTTINEIEAYDASKAEIGIDKVVFSDEPTTEYPGIELPLSRIWSMSFQWLEEESLCAVGIYKP